MKELDDLFTECEGNPEAKDVKTLLLKYIWQNGSIKKQIDVKWSEYIITKEYIDDDKDEIYTDEREEKHEDTILFQDFFTDRELKILTSKEFDKRWDDLLDDPLTDDFEHFKDAFLEAGGEL